VVPILLLPLFPVLEKRLISDFGMGCLYFEVKLVIESLWNLVLGAKQSYSTICSDSETI
jgi:hypothetical protein